MIFLFGLLTVVLVLLACLLILLVLVQLPKKDAGTGISFGGAAADALFGAGSGNVLTKITAWSTGIFFLVIVLLSYVHDNLGASSHDKNFAKKVQEQEQAAANAATTPPTTPAPATTQPAAAATNGFKLSVPTTVPSTPTPAPSTPAAPATQK
jgi:preprotein translocase subunit SecG